MALFSSWDDATAYERECQNWFFMEPVKLAENNCDLRYVMYKIVYNACYGGFSLSRKGVALIQQIAPKDSNWHKEGFVEEISKHDDSLYVRENKELRTDKYLIAVIEKYGSKTISGKCATLKVYKSHSKVVTIDSFDGYETVNEVDDEAFIVLD